MLSLAPGEIASPTPGSFWPSRFSSSRWSPSQSNFRNTNLAHSQHKAQPSDTSPFDFKYNTLAASSSIQFSVGYLVSHGRTQLCTLSVFMTRQHSEPYSRTDLTCFDLVLNKVLYGEAIPFLTDKVLFHIT